MTASQDIASATISVDAAARLIGINRGLAFRAIRETGELAGIRAIRVGRRILLPREPLEKALGLNGNAVSD